jgi:hypothetical protein
VLVGNVAGVVPAAPLVVVPPGVGVLPTGGVVTAGGVLVIGPGELGAEFVGGVMMTGAGALPCAGLVVPVCVPAAGGAAVPVPPVCATAVPNAHTISIARIAARTLIFFSPALVGFLCSDGLPLDSDVLKESALPRR